VLTGATGSGKTEIALNLAQRFSQQAERTPVILVDLDLVTPYFRSREKRRLVEGWDVTLVTPTAHGAADLPLMPPRLQELLSEQQGTLLLDVGGGEEGTRVLGSLRGKLQRQKVEHLAVVNPRRPQTADANRVVCTVQTISKISRLKHTGIVSNPNVGADTSSTQVCRDHDVVAKAAQALGLPIKWIGVYRPVFKQFMNECGRILSAEVLPVTRWMVPAWEGNNGGDVC
jgi:hypothetical protein